MFKFKFVDEIMKEIKEVTNQELEQATGILVPRDSDNDVVVGTLGPELQKLWVILYRLGNALETEKKKVLGAILANPGGITKEEIRELSLSGDVISSRFIDIRNFFRAAVRAEFDLSENEIGIQAGWEVVKHYNPVCVKCGNRPLPKDKFIDDIIDACHPDALTLKMCK